MDTTYYTFQTRKIKASGGAELVTFVPHVQPAPQEKMAVTPSAAPTGELLDFDLCRRRLETRAAWKDLTAAAQAAPQVEEPEPQAEAPTYRPVHAQPKKRQTRTRAPWVDILTSALALGLVCLVGAAALLSIV